MAVVVDVGSVRLMPLDVSGYALSAVGRPSVLALSSKLGVVVPHSVTPVTAPSDTASSTSSTGGVLAVSMMPPVQLATVTRNNSTAMAFAFSYRARARARARIGEGLRRRRAASARHEHSG